MSYSDLRTVSYFVTGTTKTDLCKNMILLNMKMNRTHSYENISFDGKEWSAWFKVLQRELAELLFKDDSRKTAAVNNSSLDLLASDSKKASKKPKRVKK